MIPTAEEYFQQIVGEKADLVDNNNHTIELMIEFAKYHVEAALKAASEKAEIIESNSLIYEIDEDSILNAYPLENIK